jgi:nitrogen regulatory protein P-II 2
MKEIKAFVAGHRVAAVIDALRASGLTEMSGARGCRNVTVSKVSRVFASRDASEQHYALDLAEPVVTEAKLELVCEDELADRVIELIAKAAHTGRPHSGWIFASPVERGTEIS